MKVYKSMRGLVAYLKAQAEAEKAARQVLVRFPNPLLGSWGTWLGRCHPYDDDDDGVIYIYVIIIIVYHQYLYFITCSRNNLIIVKILFLQFFTSWHHHSISGGRLSFRTQLSLQWQGIFEFASWIFLKVIKIICSPSAWQKNHLRENDDLCQVQVISPSPPSSAQPRYLPSKDWFEGKISALRCDLFSSWSSST